MLSHWVNWLRLICRQWRRSLSSVTEEVKAVPFLCSSRSAYRMFGINLFLREMSFGAAGDQRKCTDRSDAFGQWQGEDNSRANFLPFWTFDRSNSSFPVGCRCCFKSSRRIHLNCFVREESVPTSRLPLWGEDCVANCETFDSVDQENVFSVISVKARRRLIKIFPLDPSFSHEATNWQICSTPSATHTSLRFHYGRTKKIFARRTFYTSLSGLSLKQSSQNQRSKSNDFRSMRYFRVSIGSVLHCASVDESAERGEEETEELLSPLWDDHIFVKFLNVDIRLKAAQFSLVQHFLFPFSIRLGRKSLWKVRSLVSFCEQVVHVFQKYKVYEGKIVFPEEVREDETESKLIEKRRGEEEERASGDTFLSFLRLYLCQEETKMLIIIILFSLLPPTTSTCHLLAAFSYCLSKL